MKLYKLIVFSIFIMLYWITPVDAASFEINSSVSEVSSNGSFTVNVGGDCIGRVDLSISNGTLSTNSIWVEQNYASVTVTAGSSGQVIVTATPVVGFSDADANIYNPGSRSISVNIISNPITSDPNNTPSDSITSDPNNIPSDSKPFIPDNQNEKSEDNNLSSLTIDKGELFPEFAKDKTEYTLNLSADTSKLTIKATTHDSNAKIDGIGEINLSQGNNKIEIIVTAENGSKKTYIIKAYVEETPKVYLNYRNEKIGIIGNSEIINVPEGFNFNEYNIENHTISLFSKNNIHIIYGLNEKNEKGFYLFNKDKNELENKFIPLNINNRDLFIIDTELKQENLFLDKITINDTEVVCYKFKDDSDNYCLLNVIKEDGKVVQYLYESTENTIQLYHNFELCSENDSKEKHMFFYILCGLLIFSIGTIIFLIFKMKKGNANEKNI